MPLRRDFPVVLLALALACFALSPTIRAVTPAPDGGYPNQNTAEGDGALLNLTSGTNNTAIGFAALSSNTTGNNNTATGAFALFSNTTGLNVGDNNTATGIGALLSNTTGIENTAAGAGALDANTEGNFNTANGSGALNANTKGNNNTASGFDALQNNTTGINNTADGVNALHSNNNGNFNTADGVNALSSNMTGNRNTASGYGALANNTSGSFNIAVGNQPGVNLTTGNNNIDIGAPGAAGEANTIRIGKQGTQEQTFIAGISSVPVTGSTVVVTSGGKLGVATSSVRYKEAIKPMDKVSETILALKPVTFRYKEDLDPDGVPQFGLIAEQVEKVNPDLVVRDEHGQVMTVRYEAVNAMLLNEFLKEHRKGQEQERKVAGLEARVVQQQKQIEALTAGLQKVTEKVELTKAAPQLVNNP